MTSSSVELFIERLSVHVGRRGTGRPIGHRRIIGSKAGRGEMWQSAAGALAFDSTEDIPASRTRASVRSFALLVSNQTPQYLCHAPGLGDAAAGRVGGLSIEHFADRADAGL